MSPCGSSYARWIDGSLKVKTWSTLTWDKYNCRTTFGHDQNQNCGCKVMLYSISASIFSREVATGNNYQHVGKVVGNKCQWGKMTFFFTRPFFFNFLGFRHVNLCFCGVLASLCVCACVRVCARVCVCLILSCCVRSTRATDRVQLQRPAQQSYADTWRPCWYFETTTRCWDFESHLYLRENEFIRQAVISL